jgi:rare lipoprotein A (peptidoglycan hydrolase)
MGNPVCNRRVRIQNKSNGKTVETRIVDKCPGDQCAWGSFDLSPATFKKLGDLDTGILNISWHYILTKKTNDEQSNIFCKVCIIPTIKTIDIT